jgi:DNA helicase HerA-like ATPase
MHPIELLASLRIGTVEFVSPDEIKVLLDEEAPDTVALNAGTPRPFPRVNSYVLIPNEEGLIVGQVEWLSVERSPFPKRKGFSDFGLVDLPYPLRKMNLSILGILKSEYPDRLSFQRGITTFPAIGDSVLLPTDLQLRSIVESGVTRRVKIGTSPMAGNADVSVDPDRLFGRHLAVLGNTGSGKSCSVAGLIHWSLDAAFAAMGTDNRPNARFIILDPNGEYAHAFDDRLFKHGARVFKVNDPNMPLKVPLWFWNSAEWSSFTQASPKAQAPLLRQALRGMRNEQTGRQPPLETEIKQFIGSILITIRHEKNQGSPWGSFPKPKAFLEKISKWHNSIQDYKSRVHDTRLDALDTALQSYITPRSKQHPTYDASTSEIDAIIGEIETVFSAFGGIAHELSPKNEDTPIPFDGTTFLAFLDSLAQESGAEVYVDFLLTRIRTMLTETKMRAITEADATLSLAGWLANYVGENKAENGCLTIIDLSLVPTEIIHLVTAIVARMTLEALQRYRRREDKTLPTVLVMEEAHTFVTRYKEDLENPNTAAVCCKVFERIAREGRKFGLGLVLSSQRPSELSPTVLSQCNTFLLHRISNDRDQEQVLKLLPDSLRGLLRDLPTLPSQHAILLGWASELPVLVRMSDLSVDERPQSEDPDFWDVWRAKNDKGEIVTREIDWTKIADEWQESP